VLLYTMICCILSISVSLRIIILKASLSVSPPFYYRLSFNILYLSYKFCNSTAGLNRENLYLTAIYLPSNIISGFLSALPNTFFSLSGFRWGLNYLMCTRTTNICGSFYFHFYMLFCTYIFVLGALFVLSVFYLYLYCFFLISS
jgi:hypothetical protein